MSLLNFMAVIFIVIGVEVYIGLHKMEELHLDCEKKIQKMTNKLQDLSERVEQLENKYKEILIEECASSPCMNGATCIDGIKNYSCICMAGYNGKNCQTDIDECLSSPCKNRATCNDHVNGFTCSCADGWMGNNCEKDVDECLSSPCQNRGTCNDHVNGFTCSCADGWMGNNCEKGLYYGTSFITGFMKHHAGDTDIPTLFIACPEGTANIYVTIPALSIVNKHHEMKGGVLTLKYSNTITSQTSEVISNKGVHITADRPVMLFAYSIKETSADGSLVPPEKSLGTDYIISGYPSSEYRYENTDEFLIVGTEDRTMITMDINSVMVNITLNRMETYMRAEYNLSGSMIFSSAPVYVLSGHRCARVPNVEVTACDYIDETMPPISSLGKLHIVSYMKPRPDFTIGIAAPFSNTSVTIYDGTGTEIETFSSMNRTDAKFRTFSGSQTISVVATQPVLVTQYGHGSAKEVGYFGDPSMMTIPDVNHFGHMYYFVVPSGFKSTLVIVMRSLYSISDLLLDDVVFKASETITATITGYSAYLILYGNIDPGYHKLAHRAGTTVSFGAWIYGRQVSTEYACSLGHT